MRFQNDTLPNDAIAITVLDEPGPGGANHEYALDLTCDPNSEKIPPGITGPSATVVRFQKGPLLETGINGISNEALLAILIDRMRGFQSGDFKCRENAIALTHLEDAMHWLMHRTRQRLARGVEGKNVV